MLARRVCLRYGAAVLRLQSAGKHSALHVAGGQNGQLAVLTVTLFHGGLQKELQGRPLVHMQVVGNVHYVSFFVDWSGKNTQAFPHLSQRRGACVPRSRSEARQV